MAAGLVYVAISQAVRLKGTAWLHRLLPAVVVGPVIMVIGLALAPVAVSMATGETSDNISYGQAIFLSMASLLVTLLLAVFGRGLLRLVPIMGGIATGYALALIMGVVDFTPVREAAWLSIPNFTAPSFHWAAILFMIPVAIAPAVEHIGDMVAIGSVTRKNYLEKPGLHRTLLGDGLATTAAALFGGPPNTTYSEVTGAVTLTKAFNPKYMIVAAVIAIILAFVGKLGALLQTIPGPVMGGIMTLLFGSIAVVGMNTLVRAGQSLTAARNLVVVSLILVFGIGGMQFGGGQFTLQGVSLAALVGIALNWLLPAEKVIKPYNHSGMWIDQIGSELDIPDIHSKWQNPSPNGTFFFKSDILTIVRLRHFMDCMVFHSGQTRRIFRRWMDFSDWFLSLMGVPRFARDIIN